MFPLWRIFPEHDDDGEDEDSRGDEGALPMVYDGQPSEDVDEGLLE